MQTNDIQNLPWWHWHRHLYNWVVHWADTKFGFLALILLAITEPVCVPIPVDVLVVGMCLAKPKRSIRYGLTASFFSVLGGTIAFALGLAIGGENVIAFFDTVHLGHRAQQALGYYQRYDFWAIAISALTPVPYMLFSWLGGMANVSIIKFVLISVVFRTMRFTGEALLFYFLGARARNIIEKYFNLATIIVIIILAILVFIMKMISRLFAV